MYADAPIVPAVTFVSVVDARVDEPLTDRFARLSVPAFNVLNAAV